MVFQNDPEDGRKQPVKGGRKRKGENLPTLIREFETDVDAYAQKVKELVDEGAVKLKQKAARSQDQVRLQGAATQADKEKFRGILNAVIPGAERILYASKIGQEEGNKQFIRGMLGR